MKRALLKVLLGALLKLPLLFTPLKYTDGDANTGIWTGTVTLKQAQDGWQNTSIKEIAGIDVSAMSPKKGKTCTITYTEKTDTVAIAFPAS